MTSIVGVPPSNLITSITTHVPERERGVERSQVTFPEFVMETNVHLD